VPVPIDAQHLWPLREQDAARARTLRAFLRTAVAENGIPVRIAYVNVREPILTEAEKARFGRIEVITYAAGTKAELVAQLRSDLVRSTGGRAGPQFDVHYLVLSQLSDHLGLGDDAQTFRLLRGWSRQSSVRQQALHRREGLEFEQDEEWTTE
jgi:hypothetical protein